MGKDSLPVPFLLLNPDVGHVPPSGYTFLTGGPDFAQYSYAASCVVLQLSELGQKMVSKFGRKHSKASAVNSQCPLGFRRCQVVL